MAKSLYETLEISDNASESEIKKHIENSHVSIIRMLTKIQKLKINLKR